MGDTEEKRQRRNILSRRLDSYYEALMQSARAQSSERWEQALRAAPSIAPHASDSEGPA
jgi:hypothetical protein